MNRAIMLNEVKYLADNPAIPICADQEAYLLSA
jgi:hypothetical protein